MMSFDPADNPEWLNSFSDVAGVLGPALMAGNPNMRPLAAAFSGIAQQKKAKQESARKRQALASIFGGVLDGSGSATGADAPSQGVLSGLGINPAQQRLLMAMDPDKALGLLGGYAFADPTSEMKNIRAASGHGVDPRAAYEASLGLRAKAGTMGEKERIIAAMPGMAQVQARQVATGLAPDANSALSSRTTMRGQDVTARGQDMSQETAFRGQNVSMRGQDVGQETAFRGQDMTARTAAAGRSQAAEQFQQRLLDAQRARAMTPTMREFSYAQGNPAFAQYQQDQRRAGATNVSVNSGPSGTNYGPPPKDSAWARSPDGRVRLDDRGAPIPIPLQNTKAYREGSSFNSERQATIDKAEQSLALVEDIINHPGREGSTGLGSLLPVIPGTKRADFSAFLEQAQGQAFLQAFESLKGGGQITEVEGKKATQAMARLQTSQSDQQFLESLNDLRGIIETGLRRARSSEPSAPPASGSPAQIVPAPTINAYDTPGGMSVMGGAPAGMPASGASSPALDLKSKYGLE